MVITEEQGPSPTERRDQKRMKRMCGSVVVCRDGVEERITNKVAELIGLGG